MQYQHIGYRVRGFYNVSRMGLKHGLLMVSEEAKKRQKILRFWRQYGLEATKAAFGISRRSLFYWKKRLDAGGREPASLNPHSHQPKQKRSRNWPRVIVTEIRRLRQVHKNVGKEKLFRLLKPFCENQGLKVPSISTIGRLISDAPDAMRYAPVKVRPKTGKIVKRKHKKVKRKPKGFIAEYPGHCVAMDTIEIRSHGRKIYMKTFIDLYSRFGFAYAYRKNNSKIAKEFLELVLRVFPAKITNCLTDNGPEFKGHFAALAEEGGKREHWHIYPRRSNMNAHIERFNRSVQEECSNYISDKFDDLVGYNSYLLDYIVRFNCERPHAGINYLTPCQKLVQYHASHKHIQSSNWCNLGWTLTHA